MTEKTFLNCLTVKNPKIWKNSNNRMQCYFAKPEFLPWYCLLEIACLPEWFFLSLDPLTDQLSSREELPFCRSRATCISKLILYKADKKDTSVAKKNHYYSKSDLFLASSKSETSNCIVNSHVFYIQILLLLSIVCSKAHLQGFSFYERKFNY